MKCGVVSARSAPEKADLRGILRLWPESKADSGQLAKRGFCPSCGARLFGLPPFAPDLMVIMAASLDDPSVFKAGMNIYTASAQPWDYMDPALPKFHKMPPPG